MGELSSKILCVENLVTGYGKKTVLNGLSSNIEKKEVVALIGHNGAGKSTLLKSLFGLIPIWSGNLAIEGLEFKSLTPRELLHSGIVYVPQGNRVFTNLTVIENLEIAGVAFGKNYCLKEKIENIFHFFPALESRGSQQASTLSGGEKQMLALAIALTLSPRLLLLDEPSLGLSPLLVTKTLRHIQHISVVSGVTILIVEQKVHEVLEISHRVIVLRNGQISYNGDSSALKNKNKLREVYL